MDGSTQTGTPTPDAPRSRGCWIAVAVGAALLLCGWPATAFLVLTGVIAEPETVMEGILRTLIPS